MTEPERPLWQLHGGEVEWAVSERYNLPIDKIVSFASTVSPIIPESVKRLADNFHQLYLYPTTDQRRIKNAVGRHENLDDNQNIILGCGSTELIHLFAQVMCKGEVAIPVPTYGEYETAVTRYGGTPLFPKEGDGFGLDIHAIKRSLSARTKAIILCNPNNPTGKLYDKSEMEDVASLAKEKRVKLLVDEAYGCFTPANKKYSMTSLTQSYPILVLNSLSKLFGVPSIRLGWGIGSANIIHQLEKFKVPWTISNLAIWTGETLLSDIQYQNEITRLIESERETVLKALGEIPWLDVLPSDTNFFLVKILDDSLTSTSVFEKLVRKGMVIRDCSSMRGLGNKFFRVTVRTPEQNKRLISTLKEIAVQTVSPEL